MGLARGAEGVVYPGRQEGNTKSTLGRQEVPEKWRTVGIWKRNRWVWLVSLDRDGVRGYRDTVVREIR